MRRPDAPWVGKCKEDYYGWDDEACLLHCECCDDEMDDEDAIKVDGTLICRKCYEAHYGEEDEDDEVLHG